MYTDEIDGTGEGRQSCRREKRQIRSVQREELIKSFGLDVVLMNEHCCVAMVPELDGLLYDDRNICCDPPLSRNCYRLRITESSELRDKL